MRLSRAQNQPIISVHCDDHTRDKRVTARARSPSHAVASLTTTSLVRNRSPKPSSAARVMSTRPSGRKPSLQSTTSAKLRWISPWRHGGVLQDSARDRVIAAVWYRAGQLPPRFSPAAHLGNGCEPFNGGGSDKRAHTRWRRRSASR